MVRYFVDHISSWLCCLSPDEIGVVGFVENTTRVKYSSHRIGGT